MALETPKVRLKEARRIMKLAKSESRLPRRRKGQRGKKGETDLEILKYLAFHMEGADVYDIRDHLRRELGVRNIRGIKARLALLKSTGILRTTTKDDRNRQNPLEFIESVSKSLESTEEHQTTTKSTVNTARTVYKIGDYLRLIQMYPYMFGFLDLSRFTDKRVREMVKWLKNKHSDVLDDNKKIGHLSISQNHLKGNCPEELIKRLYGKKEPALGETMDLYFYKGKELI